MTSTRGHSHVVVAGTPDSRRELTDVLRRRTTGRFQVDDTDVPSLPSVLGSDDAFEVLVLCGHGIGDVLSGDVLHAVETRPWLYVVAPVRASHVFDTYTPGHEVEVLLSLAKACRHFAFTARFRRLESALLRNGVELPVRAGEVVAESEPMRRILHYLSAVSGFGLPLILVGEPGSGRSELARAAHAMQCPGAPFVPLRVSGMSGAQLSYALRRVREHVGADPQGPWATVHLRGVEDLGEETLAVLTAECFSAAVLPRPAAREPAPGELICVASIDAERLATLERGAPLRRFLELHADLSIRVPPLRERPEDVPALAEQIARRVCREFGVPESAAQEAAARVSTDGVFPGNGYALVSELVVHVGAILREREAAL